ncbi:MAG TPA: glycosyltransferase family 4 protein, partial [Bacteroidales bacterium]|nr:glycosyltransferase family 4 protein [Bacteroidales bacterium]
IADLGLSGHCFLAGRQDDHARVLELVKASRLFIYPSHADTAPLSLAEAMAMGKAVVATEVDGIPAMVKDGQDGLLVPPRNPERLAGAILQLLGDDRLQDELGRNARNTAQERFEAGRVARDYAALCRGLSGANGK